MSFPSIFCHYWSPAGPGSRRLPRHRPQSKTCISNPLLKPHPVPAPTRILRVWLTLTRPCFGDFPLPDEATNRRGEPPRPGDDTVQESDAQTAPLVSILLSIPRLVRNEYYTGQAVPRLCFGDFPLPDEATNRRGEPPRPGDGTVQESDVQTATLRPPFHPSEPHWLVHNKP